MLERLFKRKPKIIKIRNAFFDSTVFDIPSLKELQTHSNLIYETQNAFYAFDPSMENLVWRVKKASFKPVIRKVLVITLDPSNQMIQLDVKTLMDMASDRDAEVWEVDAGFFLVFSGITFFAEKEAKEEAIE